jgi:hypothetical protein
MIYLISSAAFKDNSESLDLEVILKIGYTREDSSEGRFKAYTTENPTRRILYLIPNGTVQDENNLHQYFKKYLKYGQEWFSYEEEILEFFKTHTTKDSLRELNYLRNDLRKMIKEKYFNKILLDLVSNPKVYFSTRDSLYNELDNILMTVDNFDSYFKSQYPTIDFDKEYVLEKANKDFDFIESFRSEFKQDENFIRRMKMYYRLVTEFPDIYKQNIKIFHTIIPSDYQGYMNLLGPERIKANGYIEVDIRNEMNSVLSVDNIKAELQMKFLTGRRYSTKYIKTELVEIYKKLNLKKTAKASDLNGWFNLKDCKVLNPETKKLDRGFEILSVK